MKRKTIFGWAVVCAFTVGSCSGTPETPLSPGGVTPSAVFLNADGSTIKATAPTGLSPANGEVTDTRRPTLRFTNPSSRFVPIGFAYEIDVQDASGNTVYTRIIGETPGTGSHGVDADLAYATTLWWRIRSRLADQAGPWSGYAMFRTLDPPPPPTPTPPTVLPGIGGGLPFPVPAACGPFGPDNRFACAAAVAGLSVEWLGCAGGRGVSCHRFSRQVVFALAQSDPNWQMIVASPGGNACNCSGCGPSDGTMFREDTTVYGGNRVYDMIVGAGGPAPSLNWSLVPGPRAGDIPSNAPLCQ